MKILRLVFLLFPFSVLGQQDTLPKLAHAQQDSSHKSSNSSWVTLGYGVAVMVNYDGSSHLGLEASYSKEMSHHLLTARLVYGVGAHGLELPRPYFLDIGALYGYSNDNKLWFVNASAGLSYIKIKQRVFDRKDTVGQFLLDVYRGEMHETVGIAYQGQIYSRFSRTSRFGIGAVMGGNVNKVQSMWFMVFCLTIGAY